MNNRARSAITTALDLSGAALIVAAFSSVATALGMFAAGVLALVGSWRLTR